MKVFVVTFFSEYTDYPPTIYTVGAYSSPHFARNAMVEEFEKMKQAWITDLGYSEEDIKADDYHDLMTLLNTENEIDTVRISISEVELDK